MRMNYFSSFFVAIVALLVITAQVPTFAEGHQGGGGGGGQGHPPRGGGGGEFQGGGGGQGHPPRGGGGN